MRHTQFRFVMALVLSSLLWAATGVVAASAASAAPTPAFRAQITAVAPINSGATCRFFSPQADESGVITLSGGADRLTRGQSNLATIRLTIPMQLSVGTRITIRCGGQTVGSGPVRSLL